MTTEEEQKKKLRKGEEARVHHAAHVHERVYVVVEILDVVRDARSRRIHRFQLLLVKFQDACSRLRSREVETSKLGVGCGA